MEVFTAEVIGDGLIQIDATELTAVEIPQPRKAPRSRVDALRARARSASPKWKIIKKRSMVTFESPTETPPVGTRVVVTFEESDRGEWVAGRATGAACLLRSGVRSLAVPCNSNFPRPGIRYHVRVTEIQDLTDASGFGFPAGAIEAGLEFRDDIPEDLRGED